MAITCVTFFSLMLLITLPCTFSMTQAQPLVFILGSQDFASINFHAYWEPTTCEPIFISNSSTVLIVRQVNGWVGCSILIMLPPLKKPYPPCKPCLDSFKIWSMTTRDINGMDSGMVGSPLSQPFSY